ncbi:hypothetical protein [Filibacter tadaridae]|uniref:hypothetical protein n=1 Tax=Filibacter tadaridae TaxID=2483811 RepID=UPI0039EB01BF
MKKIVYGLRKRIPLNSLRRSGMPPLEIIWIGGYHRLYGIYHRHRTSYHRLNLGYHRLKLGYHRLNGFYHNPTKKSASFI